MSTPPMTTELNDLSRQTRVATFAQSVGPGLMIGAMFAVGDSLALAAVLFGVGVLATLGWSIGITVWSRRLQRRLLDRVEARSTEIVSGAVAGVPVAARVVRRRVARGRPGFVARTPAGSAGSGGSAPSAVVLVATALSEAGPLRVAALVPATLGLHLRRAPLALLQHPEDREVAVLDASADAEALAAIEADPRWRTTQPPSDRSVAGGWLGALAFAILGLLLGVAVGWSAGQLLG